MVDLDQNPWARDLRGAEKLRSRFLGLPIDRASQRKTPSSKPYTLRSAVGGGLKLLADAEFGREAQTAGILNETGGLVLSRATAGGRVELSSFCEYPPDAD